MTSTGTTTLDGVSVLVLDDHRVFGDALRSALSGSGFSRVAAAGTCVEALQLHRECPFDVVVCDVSLPGEDAFDTLTLVRSKRPDTRILLLTAHHPLPIVRRALALPVHGYVLKTDPIGFVIDAVRAVALGGTCYSAAVAQDIERLASEPASSGSRSGSHGLTRRQLDVLALIAEGFSVKEIAARLHISAKAVDAHKCRIMDRLGLHDRVLLARFAISEGLVPFEREPAALTGNPLPA